APDPASILLRRRTSGQLHPCRGATAREPAHHHDAGALPRGELQRRTVPPRGAPGAAHGIGRAADATGSADLQPGGRCSGPPARLRRAAARPPASSRGGSVSRDPDAGRLQPEVPRHQGIRCNRQLARRTGPAPGLPR
ncbi:MAG: Transcriptional regulator, LysR family, partial [uncultured Ramlibacter sp.]